MTHRGHTRLRAIAVAEEWPSQGGSEGVGWGGCLGGKPEMVAPRRRQGVQNIECRTQNVERCGFPGVESFAYWHPYGTYSQMEISIGG